MNKEMIPTRIEEIQESLIQDEIREKSREIDDGVFETWLEENKSELQEAFSIDNKQDFEEYAKMQWEER